MVLGQFGLVCIRKINIDELCVGKNTYSLWVKIPVWGEGRWCATDPFDELVAPTRKIRYVGRLVGRALGAAEVLELCICQRFPEIWARGCFVIRMNPRRGVPVRSEFMCGSIVFIGELNGHAAGAGGIVPRSFDYTCEPP